MNREYEQNNHESGLFETTFGVDGEVETYTNEKAVRFFCLFGEVCLDLSLSLSIHTYACILGRMYFVEHSMHLNGSAFSLSF